MKNITSFIIGLALVATGCKSNQDFYTGSWRGEVIRKDGRIIPFNFETKDSAGKKILYVQNAAERILVDSIIVAGDSVFIQMPFFDSRLRTKLVNGNLEGEWVRPGNDGDISIPFRAIHDTKDRFTQTGKTNVTNVSGRWSVNFVTIPKGDTTPSVGEFIQTGNIVTGTFLNPSGDYRYLQGVVDGDSLRLSCFDGGHAYLFTAKIEDGQALTGGNYYSGASHVETWTARRDDNARLPDEYAGTTIKAGDSILHFKFISTSGDSVSMDDARFKNKVVLVQISGSWCPNCMDETAFLSDYYNRHRSDGIEIVALCYERTTDFEKSKKTIGFFQKDSMCNIPCL